MSVIRSTSLPAVPGATRPQAPEAARAAQRAFFEAALGGQAAAAGPTRTRETQAASAPAATAPAVRVTPTRMDAPPDRILRPGSLLDIKV